MFNNCDECFSDVNLDPASCEAKNHINLQFKVDIHGDRGKHLGEKILSRRSSLVLTKVDEGPEDTVENVLKVSSFKG